jgi:hypothetical protein
MADEERLPGLPAAHLGGRLLAPADVPFVERLRGALAWIEFLNPSDREAVAEEVVDVARAYAAMSRFDRLLLLALLIRRPHPPSQPDQRLSEHRGIPPTGMPSSPEQVVHRSPCYTLLEVDENLARGGWNRDG